MKERAQDLGADMGGFKVQKAALAAGLSDVTFCLGSISVSKGLSRGSGLELVVLGLGPRA